MATYKVNPNSFAPEEATAGDFIVTGGGTYKVLDSEKYKGMDAAALKGIGVSYNPSSGLYSSKVNSVTPGDVVLQPTTKLDEWKTNADAQVKASIDSAYQKNISNLGQAYNTNKGELLNQTEDVKQQYLNNMLQHKEDTYIDMKNALYGAEQRGMMNSAQGQAMTNAGLWDASRETSQLSSERDYLVNQIKTNINSLTSNYNLGLNELEKSKLSAEIDGLSENKLQYLASLMDIDKSNTAALNAANEAKKAAAIEAKKAAAYSGYNKYNSGGGYTPYSKPTGVDGSLDSLYTYAQYIISKDSSLEGILDEYFQKLQIGKITPEEYRKMLDRYYTKVESQKAKPVYKPTGLEKLFGRFGSGSKGGMGGGTGGGW